MDPVRILTTTAASAPSGAPGGREPRVPGAVGNSAHGAGSHGPGHGCTGPTYSQPSDPRPVVGRLAPSPTGLLHLGNAWAFLLAWLSARSRGGRVLLRMEDLDPQRSRPAFAAAIEKDLAWLGLDWDAGPGDDRAGDAPDSGPLGPSARAPVYARARARLERAGLT
ncbi:MAG: hypothetical protein K2G99_00540, partial [Desulfovibrio sp.]|nr:hypothetical protein [Desulfovibrio sp.]